ncbi:MAG: hypothetical protein K9L86_01825 [Candidatus Omnitrophica bacterium]|nr:hypothetical protein [Candidatus Omnitrophota bacterium]
MANKLIHFSQKGILTCLLFSFCLVAIPFLSSSLQTATPAIEERILFVPPAEFLRSIKGGFKNIIADTYYIRGVLAISDEFKSRKERIKWVQEVFKAAVLLDPDMLQAYFFAGSAIVNSKEEIKQGNEFLKFGLTQSPSYWQIPYWIGFNYYLLDDYLSAAEFYRKASLFPEAPNYLKSNQPMLYYRAGEVRLGLMYLEGLLESVSDPDQLKWLKLKIEWLKNMVVLQDKVEQFKDRYQRLPNNLAELVDRNFISEIPNDPFGGGYYLGTESGKIRSRFGKRVEADTKETDPIEPKKSCSSCKK